MTLYDLFKEIETQEFQARFLVLSGLSTVRSAMKNNEVVSALTNLLHNNIDNQLAIHKRIEQLMPQFDDDYMHPYDIPVTAYLFALNEVKNVVLLESVIHQISDIQQFFWARKLADNLIKSFEYSVSHNQFESYVKSTFVDILAIEVRQNAVPEIKIIQIPDFSRSPSIHINIFQKSMANQYDKLFQIEKTIKTGFTFQSA